MNSQTIIQYSHLLPTLIEIPSNETWTILDTTNVFIEQTIVLQSGSALDFYSARTEGSLKLHIMHRGTKSTSNIYCGFHVSEQHKIEAVIKSSFMMSDAESNIHILSLADTGGEVFLDSAIDIREGVIDIIGRLKERHIFLGSEGRIRGIPALIVHSDDIEASHALAIDRISDEELFYLRSRGFSRDDARGLVLDGAIAHIFKGLEMMDVEIASQCRHIVLGQ